MRAASIVFIILCVASTAAHAQTKADVTRARAHFVTGEAAFKRGDFDVAIREYEAAYALVPRAELLFNIGSAYRRRGEAGSLADKKAALEHYRRYLDAAPDGKGAPDARRRIEALNAAIAEAEKPPPEPPSTPPVAPLDAPPPVAAAPVAPRDAPGRSRRPWRIAGIATAGAGVALVAAGVFFGLEASAAKDDLGELGPGDPWDQDRYDDGRSAERNMFIALGVGAAAIAGGTVMYFVLGRERPAATLGAVPLRGGGALVWGTRF